MGFENMGDVGGGRDGDVITCLLNIKAIEVLEKTKIVEGGRIC